MLRLFYITVDCRFVYSFFIINVNILCSISFYNHNRIFFKRLCEYVNVKRVVDGKEQSQDGRAGRG